ncbi:MAG: hypothetical protein H0T45_08050 [Pyrinomonadaceae bacterium]|nr:hypothetical protein [Pyrinomonadaceae bacterium]
MRPRWRHERKSPARRTDERGGIAFGSALTTYKFVEAHQPQRATAKGGARL